MENLSKLEPKKTIAGVFAAMIACTGFAVLMNMKAESNLGSQCQVYIADKTYARTFHDSSEYNFEGLHAYVSDYSIPQWINPLWRIPTICIEDAKGEKTWVIGDTVRNLGDDQYSIFGSAVTTVLTEKLAAVNTDKMTFPLTLKWTQVEGGDMLRVLRTHLAIAAVICLWAAFLIFLSFKGCEFFQNHYILAVVALMWLWGCLHTSAAALESPPTGAMIDEIQKVQKGGLAQPCQHGTDTAFYIQILRVFLVVQIPVMFCFIPFGKKNCSVC